MLGPLRTLGGNFRPLDNRDGRNEPEILARQHRMVDACAGWANIANGTRDAGTTVIMRAIHGIITAARHLHLLISRYRLHLHIGKGAEREKEPNETFHVTGKPICVGFTGATFISFSPHRAQLHAVDQAVL